MKPHPFEACGCCPCEMDRETIALAWAIHASTRDIAMFAAEMERRRVTGKHIRYDAAQNIIYITKRFATETQPEDASFSAQVKAKCHCSHYQQARSPLPLDACACGGAFYLPLFAPYGPENVTITAHQTVLAGDAACVFAVHIHMDGQRTSCEIPSAVISATTPSKEAI